MAENVRAKLVNVSCESIRMVRTPVGYNVNELRCRSASKMNSLRGAHLVMKTLRNFLVLFSLVTQSP
jgi:hypothetical protein